MNNYRILSELKLCIEYYTGIWNSKKLIELRKIEMNDKNYLQTYNSLIIYDNARMDEVVNRSVKQYQAFLSQNKNTLGKRNVAILAHTPFEAVAGSIAESDLASLHKGIKVFSTYDAALQYLNLLQYKDQIQESIEELKTSLE